MKLKRASTYASLSTEAKRKTSNCASLAICSWPTQLAACPQTIAEQPSSCWGHLWVVYRLASWEADVVS